MIKYKRLTDKEHGYKKCASCSYRNCQYCDDIYEIKEQAHTRLAELEDKIENGTLKEIPENAVVLTNEEYDKLGLFEETVQEYKSDNGQLILVKEQKKLQKYSTDIADFIRKETAKEILQCLYDKCYETQYSRGGFAHITPLDILTLTKQYGVEVEE